MQNTVGSASLKDHMQIITDPDEVQMHAYSNKEVAVISVVRKLNLPANNVAFTSPVFFLFTDKMIPSDSLSALRAIRFANQGEIQDENH
ncbi:hypothetical protein [Brevibacillus massiliensis]|uniref:hypothetical protein n=1 Tax=Brevibacillus massiliensis TaxID=1118054 RepID=UPI001C54D5D8|nr:hypothetical protein [Brevibacillus massiliensis]